MWPVDKRFCNDANFVEVKERDKAFKMLPYEKQLLDNDPSYYRVLNLTVNTFNDARTSYYLKSIGGYSAAKLRRYQDLIDEHISKMNWSVINMLNTKYIISKGQDGQPYPYPNPDALGNCWLVDSLLCVDNANDESDALRRLDLGHVAVTDISYEANKALSQTVVRPITSETDVIRLTSFSPKQLTYESSTTQDRLAVFSEIYYPYGWKTTIDGSPTDLYRVNYMLRAIQLPAGKHQIVMTFAPDSVRKGNTLSYICFGIFILCLLSYIAYILYKKYHA